MSAAAMNRPLEVWSRRNPNAAPQASCQRQNQRGETAPWPYAMPKRGLSVHLRGKSCESRARIRSTRPMPLFARCHGKVPHRHHPYPRAIVSERIGSPRATSEHPAEHGSCMRLAVKNPVRATDLSSRCHPMKHSRPSCMVAAILVTAAGSSARADPAPSAVVAAQPTDPLPPAKHETRRELSAATVPQPVPAPSAVPGPTPEELRHRRMTVRIDSTRPDTVVERRTSVKEEIGAFIVIPFHATDATWEQVCVTPCDVDLDRFSTYRISPQNKVSGSHVFTLPQQVDALHLTIDSGSLLAHRLGQTLSVFGLSAIVVGVSLLVAAPDFRQPSDARIAGGITGGTGAVLAAVGIPLALLTTSRVGSDVNHEIAKVYSNHGYAIPFVPDIKLSQTVTLTQRGLIF
jgi:hypothetical protein